MTLIFIKVKSNGDDPLRSCTESNALCGVDRELKDVFSKSVTAPLHVYTVPGSAISGYDKKDKIRGFTA